MAKQKAIAIIRKTTSDTDTTKGKPWTVLPVIGTQETVQLRAVEVEYEGELHESLDAVELGEGEALVNTLPYLGAVDKEDK